jgi:hypothetical protein
VQTTKDVTFREILFFEYELSYKTHPHNIPIGYTMTTAKNSKLQSSTSISTYEACALSLIWFLLFQKTGRMEGRMIFFSKRQEGWKEG